MPKLEDTIAEELLSLESVAELTLQRIQTLRKKLNPKPRINKNRPLSQEQVNRQLAKHIKNTIKKTN